MNPSCLAILPDHLKEIGFVSRKEIAWTQEDCGEAIVWLRRNGYAILGIELWVIQDSSIGTAVATESGPAIYATSCDPIKGEKWRKYIERSAREAAIAIFAFNSSKDELGPSQSVHFNLTWADREWFRSNGTYETYFIDE